MRTLMTLVLAAGALWIAATDWQATIGRGYAFRPGSIGGQVSGRWPEAYAGLVDGLKASGLPWAWDPVGAFLLSLPLALTLAAVAALLWVTRERRPRR